MPKFCVNPKHMDEHDFFYTYSTFVEGAVDTALDYRHVREEVEEVLRLDSEDDE